MSWLELSAVAAAVRGALTRVKSLSGAMAGPTGNALRAALNSRWIHDELRRIDDGTRHSTDGTCAELPMILIAGYTTVNCAPYENEFGGAEEWL